jgi:hypothetical protein
MQQKSSCLLLLDVIERYVMCVIVVWLLLLDHVIE